MAIERKLGASEEYTTGDGTTKNLLPNGQKRGVMETFTYDKNPDTLGDLEQSGTDRNQTLIDKQYAII